MTLNKCNIVFNVGEEFHHILLIRIVVSLDWIDVNLLFVVEIQFYVTHSNLPDNAGKLKLLFFQLFCLFTQITNAISLVLLRANQLCKLLLINIHSLYPLANLVLYSAPK